MSGTAHDGWIGVDFDGTLAKYEKWEGATATGEPIPIMVERVRAWLAKGKNIRIVTARVYAPNNNARRQREAAESMIAIQNWCLDVQMEDYPGQAFFHRYNANIRRAEENWRASKRSSHDPNPLFHHAERAADKHGDVDGRR